MSLTRAEKLKKRSNPFFEPPMAVIGSKPPEATIKIRNFGGVYGQNIRAGFKIKDCGPRESTVFLTVCSIR